MSYLSLFLSFVQVGLFSVGGGYAAIPLIQAEAVGRHGWLTLEEFSHLVTIAEMTPGPIAVNAATFVGIRVGGLPGAVVATFGCILPSIFIVSLLALLYARYRTLSLMQNILETLRPVVVALIASAGLSILLLVSFREGVVSLGTVAPVGVVLFAAALLVLRKWKWSPILTMALCGAAYLGVTLLLEAL